MVNTLTENKLIKDEISENIIDITKRLAEEEGAHNVTVRQILKELNVTNRVFYNRFHNVEEVLEFIYRRAVVNMRKSFNSKIDSKTDV
ncbi:helix-turn-helix transcriptional regulator, partial [bacterium]|nr:helix-turn-helix transcriptional regulator [bacterium]